MVVVVVDDDDDGRFVPRKEGLLRGVDSLVSNRCS